MGYEQPSLAVVMRGGTVLKASEAGGNPIAVLGDETFLPGFAWPDNTERLLDGAVWATTDRQGRGNVVLFADDILFRGFWRGTARLLTNAILFGSGRWHLPKQTGGRRQYHTVLAPTAAYRLLPPLTVVPCARRSQRPSPGPLLRWLSPLSDA